MRLPYVLDLTPEIKNARDFLRLHGMECTDIRLQVQDNGAWALHTGDSSYDTDHTGHWGASSVDSHDNYSVIRTIARDLIDEVEESIAMSA